MFSRSILLLGTACCLLVAGCSKKDDLVSGLPDRPSGERALSSDGIGQIDSGIESFMTTFDVPGVSLAVARNGKLVYAKGYGEADQEAGLPVDTSSLFRVGSLSKFLTSVAIMQLLEDGLLSMDDNVFGPGAILGTDFGTLPYGAYIADITVDHLLHHTLGGWPNVGGDPAFTNPSATVEQLISWTMDNRPLTDEPGEVYAYSNMGYLILGRIIEKLSGETYVDYMQEHVFGSSGVSNMQIAGNTLAERKPDEVKYYGQGGQDPYGYGGDIVSRLESCGGWIGSPIDVLRVVMRIDGFSTVPDMLQPATVEIMSEPSDANSNYACGWYLSATSRNWYHGGSLRGTYAWAVRLNPRPDGNQYSWVILVNTRPPDVSAFRSAINGLVWPAISDQTTEWPDIDLF